jgi:hypothetical protein
MSKNDKIQSAGRLVSEYREAKESFTLLRGDLEAYMFASSDLIVKIGDQSPLEYGQIVPEVQKLVDFSSLHGTLAEIAELAKKLESMHAQLKALGIDVDTAFMSPFAKGKK